MQTYMTPQEHFRIARNGGLTLFLTLAFIAVSWCQDNSTIPQDSRAAEEYFAKARAAERHAQFLEIQKIKFDAKRRGAYVRSGVEDFLSESQLLQEKTLLLHDQAKSDLDKRLDAEILKGQLENESNEEVGAESKALSDAKLDEFNMNSLRERERPLKDFPQGVSEEDPEVLKYGEAVIGISFTRIVRLGDVVTRYRKVVMKTGTFYYRGDRNISKLRWEMETTPPFN